MRHGTLPSLSAQNALKKLGADISAARKWRKMTQKRLADGAGVSLPTIRRLENGDEGVSLATLAMVFVVLGEVGRLANLLDAGIDDVGLLLGNRQLPKRVRSGRTSKPAIGSNKTADAHLPQLPPSSETARNKIGEEF